MPKRRGKALGFLGFWTALICGASVVASAQTSQPIHSASSFPSAQISKECRQAATANPHLSAFLKSAMQKPTAENYERLGTALGQAGDSQCAAAAFTAALALNPSSAGARYSLALALIENHQPQRAETELRALLRQ